MTARIWSMAFAAILASACGSSSVGETSGILDPIGAADDPRPGVPGQRCNLATVGGDSDILMVAFQDAAVVRVDGNPVALRYQGSGLRHGGTFEGGGLTIMIGGISGQMASLTGQVGVPVVAAIRQGDSVENLEAIWTCGIMRPQPAGS